MTNPKLFVVQSGDPPMSEGATVSNQQQEEPAPTRDELLPFAQAFVAENPDLGLTADDLLESATHVELFLGEWRKNMRRLQNEEALRKREALKKAEVILRQKMGLPPLLSQEELQKKIEQVKATATFAQKAEAVGFKSASSLEKELMMSDEELIANSTPLDVLSLKEKYGTVLLDVVFEEADQAILFRGWLISRIKPFHGKIKENGLEAGHKEFLVFLRDDVQGLIDKVDEVIKAWGYKDPSEPRVDNPQMYAAIREKASEDSRYRPYLEVPSIEEYKKLEQAKLDEVKTEESRSMKRAEIFDLLKAAGMPEEGAERCAHNIVRKHGGDLLKAAINKALASKSNEDDEMVMAKIYAKAAGLTEDLFLLEVQEAKLKADKEADRQRRIKETLSYGAVKNDVASKDKAKKKGQDNNQGGKKGRKKH